MVGTLPPVGATFALRPKAPGMPLARQPLDLAPPVRDAVIVEIHACALGRRDASLAAAGPFAPGRAAFGRAVACGDDASQLLGREVLVPGRLPCGECAACQRAGCARCSAALELGVHRDGALASHVVVPARYVCEIAARDEGAHDATGAARALLPDPLSLALVAGPALRAYDALARASVGAGDVLVVLGAEAEGAVVTALAAGRGASVLLVDDDPTRLARTAAFGAQATIDGGGLAPPRLFRRLVERAEEAHLPIAAWRAIETTGRRVGIARAMAIAVPGLRIVLCCEEPEPIPLALPDLCDLQAHATGVREGHPDLLAELAALVTSGELKLAELARPIAWEEAGASLDALRRAADPLGRVPVVRFAGATA